MNKLQPILQWSASDDNIANTDSMLLACCAAFYEEIASIKRAHQEGRLAAYLSSQHDSAPVSEAEFAARVSARLLNLLRQQNLEFRRNASVAQIKAHQAALYVMAALADDIFILELDWPGSEAWINAPLEQQLFGTCRAGLAFFELADRLIKSQSTQALHADLASVFLLALQLGFKGEHRGRHGHAVLHQYRQRLFHVANANQRRLLSYPSSLHDLPWPAQHKPVFLQAYQHPMADGQDLRLAPLSPWRRLLKFAALGYLLLSSLIWLWIVYPLEK